MQQAQKCGIKNWIDGFQKVGSYSWSASKIVIGTKSWCGGDTPSACQMSDTGIWGYKQMQNILKSSGARGVYMWSLNNYFKSGYYTSGNPINDKCSWANRVAQGLGLTAAAPVYKDSTFCQSYTGPQPSGCPAAVTQKAPTPVVISSSTSGIQPAISGVTATTTTVVKNKLPAKIIGGYVCGGWSLTADQVINAGFNTVLVGFVDVVVANGKFSLKTNLCCDAPSAYEMSKQLLAQGVTVILSVGGDGCQGQPPTGLETLTLSAIVSGWKSFIQSSGVSWSGIDFDWEGSHDNMVARAINRVGAALIPQGWLVTTAAMSSQLNPGALMGWSQLDPSKVSAVLPQWY
jgi:hypothetical protein